MDIQIISPITHPAWDEILLRTPGASFFHSSAWARVLSESYGYSPRYFTVMDNDKVLALIPVMEVKSYLTGKRGVSLPFTDFCDPIIDDQISVGNLFTFAKDFGKDQGWRYLEVRGKGYQFEKFLASASFYRHILPLADGREALFHRFRKGTKSSIKKAEKDGVKVEMFTSIESLREFYKLNCITRKFHGLPPQPWRFFELLHRSVLSKGLGIVILAYYEGFCIAGGVFLNFGDTAVYKYGATDRRHQSLSATTLIVWEAIKFYIERKAKMLCLGRTDQLNEGLRTFKRGWGATEQEISYYRYDFEKGAFVSATSGVKGFHNKIFNKMPLPILNRIGNILYRHVG